MPNKPALAQIAEEKHELEMTPMIDVTFLLLIFFLSTLKFKTLEGKLAAYLPKDLGTAHPIVERADPIQVRLTVSDPGTKLAARPDGSSSGRPFEPGRDHRFTFSADRQILIRVQSRTFQTIEQAQDRLAELRAVSEDPIVRIEPRAGVVYAEVAEVLNALLESGFDSIEFSGAYQE